MKKLHASIGIGLLVAVIIAVGLAQTAVAAREKQLPFSSSGPERVIQEAPHPDCGPGKLKVNIEGSGQGTYTGQYTITRQHCFDLATTAIEDGSFEQTAANGDKLWGTYSGSPAGVQELDENGNPVVILIHSEWAITGGTGRFTDAEGAGTTKGVLNFITKKGDFSSEGWIKFNR